MTRIRWAAGSRTVTDFLRGRFFGDPAADLVAWRSGESVAISAFRDVGGRTRQGRLVVGRGCVEPLSWQGFRPLRGYSGEVVVPPAPVSWAGAVDLFRGVKSSFDAVALMTGDGEWRVAVPRRDVALLHEAVSHLRTSE